MAKTATFRGPDWESHVMGPSSGSDPFITFEDDDSEKLVIDDALGVLVKHEVIPGASYDIEAFDRFRASVKEHFDIPWTGISPRMRRLLYAINAVAKPEIMVCAGIFCGYTFICNAGAAIGAGSVYDLEAAYGIEIVPGEAERASDNISRFAPEASSEVVVADAAEWLKNRTDLSIDMLYIDAKSIEFDPVSALPRPSERKSEYLKIIEAAIDRLHEKSLVLAHNSRNAVKEVNDYLSFVRGDQFATSINLVVDDAGLEVSVLGDR